jgi:hypothetical protein
LVNFYKEKGPKIFSFPKPSFGQWTGPKYSRSNLKRAAAEVFGSARVSQSVVEVLVTTYDTQLRRPLYFQRDRAKLNPNHDHLMSEVALATSAAPTIFPAYKLGENLFIDGGIVANNPSCVAFAHAKTLWPKEEVLLLSIGTGSFNRPLPSSSVNWGKAQWISPLIDCLFDGSAQAVDDFFRHAHLHNYLRLQGNLNELTERLDVTTESAMKGLESIAIGIVQTQEKGIFDFLSKLKDAGSVLGGKITRPLDGRLVRLGALEVEGTISSHRDEILYLFTGKLGKYWPSARVVPENGNWASNVNVGHAAIDATITLARVDKELANYIEFYRRNAAALSHPGMEINNLSDTLDIVSIRLDHR